MQIAHDVVRISIDGLLGQKCREALIEEALHLQEKAKGDQTEAAVHAKPKSEKRMSSR